MNLHFFFQMIVTAAKLSNRYGSESFLLGAGVSKSRQMSRVRHDTDKLSQGPSPDKWVKVVRQDIFG